jgi:hypothetical protein
LITKPEVERKLLVRLQKKAATYAQDIVDSEPSGNAPLNGRYNKIDVDGVVDLYESYIIPLTKEVEVGVGITGFPPINLRAGRLPFTTLRGIISRRD